MFDETLPQDLRLDCLIAAHAATLIPRRGRMAAERWLEAEQRVQHALAKGATRREIGPLVMAAQDRCGEYRATQMTTDDIWGGGGFTMFRTD